MRDQNKAGRRPVVVELSHERRQHLACGERAVRFGKIGAIAPVLAGAEEEHLDTGESALLIQREYIGFLDAARINALMRLDRRERGKAVAVDRSALEIERHRRLLHLVSELAFDLLAASGQKLVGLTHQRRIIGKVDFFGARSRAAFDLIKQAWTRAAFKKWIAAGAQQERTLQRVDGAI